MIGNWPPERFGTPSDAPPTRIPQPVIGIRPDAEVAAQEMECATCKFNVNWVCEHVGCISCSGSQRNTGGLKAYIRRTDFKCPKKQ